MVLSDLSIRRPVLATVMSLVVGLVGLIAYGRLTVREYPKIDEPVVTVETTFKGASADIIESQVTQILEESLSGIEGIDYMSSISRQEKSQITIRFRLDREPDAAANDVRDRVSRQRSLLPDDIDEPVIAKVEADAQPILYLAFSSDRAIGARGHRFRRPLRQGPAAEPARGRRRADLRRAPLCHADLARCRAPGRLPPDAGRRRERAHAPEHRDPGRPDREHGARIHGRQPDRSQDARAVRGHHPARGQRLSGPPRRRRARRARGGRPPRQRALQRPQRGRARGRQAGHRQPARRRQGGREGAADHPAGSAGRHAHRHGLQQLDLHPALDRCGVRDDRRGDRAGRAGDLLLPALAARDPDPAGHDPGQPGRRVCR